MSTETRAYGNLRDIIERRGGTMTYERQEYRHGAWGISLDGKTAVFESTGNRRFPALDRLYVPKVARPQTWDDYSDELVADAERQLLALLGNSGGPRPLHRGDTLVLTKREIAGRRAKRKQRRKQRRKKVLAEQRQRVLDRKRLESERRHH